MLWLSAHSLLKAQPASHQKESKGEINLPERRASSSPVIIQDMLGSHQGKEKLCNILAKARQKPNYCLALLEQSTEFSRHRGQGTKNNRTKFHHPKPVQISVWIPPESNEAPGSPYILVLWSSKSCAGWKKEIFCFFSKSLLLSSWDLEMWCVLFMIFSQHQTWTCIYVAKHLLKQRLDVDEIEAFHIKQLPYFWRVIRRILFWIRGILVIMWPWT